MAANAGHVHTWLGGISGTAGAASPVLYPGWSGAGQQYQVKSIDHPRGKLTHCLSQYVSWGKRQIGTYYCTGVSPSIHTI
jgi:hypothetical protein